MSCIDASASLLQAVQTASSQWIHAFNTGDAAAAAACYEPDAVMTASPFGTFTGRASIQAFWTKLVDDGFSDVRYISPQFTALSETEMVVSANWTMNKAHASSPRSCGCCRQTGARCCARTISRSKP
ncbi:hypothetical protein PINS_up016032 [Pythium insidiosum]|nr:hypothetical protein PINS_up016032 [Pythium insidiosum]